MLPVAIVLDLPPRLCAERNAARPDRDFGDACDQATARPAAARACAGLAREGFRTVHHLTSEAEIAEAVITRTRLYNDLRDETGPFDVVGDVHGCRAELETLLGELGYAITRDDHGRPIGAHHDHRRMIFVGDLVDRGPDTPGVLRLVMGMVAAGDALCVSGNHEAKLVRALSGRNVKVSHGLAETLAQLEAEPEEFRAAVQRVRRRVDQPLRARRRAVGGRPRRADRALPGSGVGPGPVVLPVRRHHRGDRRVRAAGPAALGRELPRSGDGALRAHAGARGGVGQQHPLPGHRMRVRRPADRAALPGAGGRQRAGRRGLLRAGPAVPGQPGRRTCRRDPRPGGARPDRRGR